MQPRYRAPLDLVRGLQDRSREARRQLAQLLREGVERLMAALIARHGLGEDRHLLTDHALQLAENDLRFRDASSYAGLSWAAFRAGVLMQLTRLASQPAGGPRPPGPAAAAGALPCTPAYHTEVYSRPFARLGDQFFGGDWYAGRAGEDGSLWVFVADVTGHGYYAFLLARGLHALWQGCWAARAAAAEPAELLAAMHHQLKECLPDGIFLECTLARLRADGRATVAPAGGSRLLVRWGGAAPALVRLRGAWLGVSPPAVEEQHELYLGPGDEVVLTTDGALDQLDEHGGLGPLGAAGAGWFEALRGRVEAALAAGPQLDDITLVLVRRQQPEGGDV